MHFDFEDLMKNLNKSLLIKENVKLGDLFESGISISIENVKNELNNLEIELKEFEAKPLSDSYKETGTQEDTDRDILEDQAECQWKIGWLKESLTSIYEMRIINLFKCLEIEIKELIKYAYPKVNTKDFYRWDIVKAFLKSKDIIIADIPGYAETSQLRKITNQIKHSGDLTDEIKLIPEFQGSEYFNSENLNIFYTRAYPQVNCFLSNLSKGIYKERYEFGDEKLTNIANEFKERMDGKTRNELILKLR